MVDGEGQVGSSVEQVCAQLASDPKWQDTAERVSALVADGDEAAAAEVLRGAFGRLSPAPEATVRSVVALAGLLDDTSGALTEAAVRAAGPEFAEAGQLAVLRVRVAHLTEALEVASARVDELAAEVDSASSAGLRETDAARVALASELAAERALRVALADQVAQLMDRVEAAELALSAARGERDAARRQARQQEAPNAQQPQQEAPNAQQPQQETPNAQQQAPSEPEGPTQGASAAAVNDDWLATVLQQAFLAGGEASVAELARRLQSDTAAVESAVAALAERGLVTVDGDGGLKPTMSSDEAFTALIGPAAGTPDKGAGVVPKSLGKAAVAASYNIKYWGEVVEPYLIDGSKHTNMLTFLEGLRGSPDTAVKFFTALGPDATVWFQQRLREQQPALSASRGKDGTIRDVQDKLRLAWRAARRTAISVDPSLDHDMSELYEPEAKKLLFGATLFGAAAAGGPVAAAALGAVGAMGAWKLADGGLDQFKEVWNLPPRQRTLVVREAVANRVESLLRDGWQVLKAAPSAAKATAQKADEVAWGVGTAPYRAEQATEQATKKAAVGTARKIRTAWSRRGGAGNGKGPEAPGYGWDRSRDVA